MHLDFPSRDVRSRPAEIIINLVRMRGSEKPGRQREKVAHLVDLEPAARVIIIRGPERPSSRVGELATQMENRPAAGKFR